MAYQNENFPPGADWPVDEQYTDAETYDKRAESSVLEKYVLNLWQPFLKNKIAQISDNKVVVDWGCGTCEYIQTAISAKKIYAIDISQDMIKACYKKLMNFSNKEIICSSGFKNEIPAGIADLVLTIGVWEYVNPILLHGEIRRLTRKGSRVIVVSPNFYNCLNLMRSIFKLKKVAVRPGFIKKIFNNDFITLESTSFGNVFWFPKKIQFLVLPIWKFCDWLWRPFKRLFPLGVNVYYLFERK